MRANADIKAENSRLCFHHAPEQPHNSGLGFPKMLELSLLLWAATKRDHPIHTPPSPVPPPPHAHVAEQYVGSTPKKAWCSLELECKNGNSNKQQDHCSSRDLHLSWINTRELHLSANFHCKIKHPGWFKQCCLAATCFTAWLTALITHQTSSILQ